MLYYVLLYYFMLCYVILCYIMCVCYVIFILYNVMLGYITLCYIVLFCIVLYCIILYCMYVCMYVHYVYGASLFQRVINSKGICSPGNLREVSFLRLQRNNSRLSQFFADHISQTWWL